MDVQALTESDAVDVSRICHELGMMISPSIENGEHVIRSVQNGGCGFKLIENGSTVGGVTLKTTKYVQCAEIGFWVAKAHQRKGIAAEGISRVIQHAFTEGRYTRIFGWCSSRNVASARTMEKAGMQREGTLRNHLFADGMYLDALYYGILAGTQIGPIYR